MSVTPYPQAQTPLQQQQQDGSWAFSFADTWRRVRESKPVAVVGNVMATGVNQARQVGSSIGSRAAATGPALRNSLVRLNPRNRAMKQQLAAPHAQSFMTPRSRPRGGGLQNSPMGGAASRKGAGTPAPVAPLSQTLVQDTVKWLNLARCFAPCMSLPGAGARRRVRFGAPAKRKKAISRSALGLDEKCKDVLQGNGSSGGGCASSRPVYLQVRGASGLVWPTFEGAQQSCYCALLVGDGPGGSGGTQVGCTQQVVCGAATNPQWNEVFTVPRKIVQEAGGRVIFQVWILDSYLGDDVLVGQAELPLAAMLAADQPHPLAASLTLQAIDEDTNQVEPGSCGEVIVAAWMETVPQQPVACRLAAAMLAPATGAGGAEPHDVDEVGVVTSNLQTPCGSKILPQVIHGPLGTLYEEPCVVVLKLTVSSLLELNFELLQASAQQGGISKRRVRMGNKKLKKGQTGTMSNMSDAVGASPPERLGHGGRRRRRPSRSMDDIEEMDDGATGPDGTDADDTTLQSALTVSEAGGLLDGLLDDLSSMPGLSLNGDEGERPGMGPGTYYYFKVAVDKQSHKGRMRWLATSATQPSLSGPSVTPLQPSTFIFVLARPLPNCPVTLTLYVSPSARKRGRVVARASVPLYDVLDHLLRARDSLQLTATGKPTELSLPFEDSDLGAVQLSLQLADNDHRPLLYGVPLVEDPHALQEAERALGLMPTTVMPAHPLPGAAPSAANIALLAGPAPVAEPALLAKVLREAGVDPLVEALFMRDPHRLMRLGTAAGGGSKRPSQGGADSPDSVLGAAGLASGLSLETFLLPSNGVEQLPANMDPFATAQPPSLSSHTGSHPGSGTPRNALAALPSAPANSAATALAPGAAGADAAMPSTVRPLNCPITAMKRRALGSVALRIQSLNVLAGVGGASSGVSSYTCVIKCGPHWLRTQDLQAQEAGLPQWQVVFPLYDPATTLTIGVFANSSKSVLTWSDQMTLVSRVHIKLSTILPNKRTWQLITLTAVKAAGKESAGGAPTQPPGSTPASAGGAGAAGAAAVAAPAANMVGVVGVKLHYPLLVGLAISYLAAPHPESLYDLALDGTQQLKVQADSQHITENWLSSAQPPIPPMATRALLDESRTQFEWARTKANFRRAQDGWQQLVRLGAWWGHICSWREPRDSWEVVACITLLCYFPGLAMKLFIYMLGLTGLRRYMEHQRRHRAQALHGTVAGGTLATSAGGAGPQARDQAPGGDAGGDDDDGVDVPVGAVAELKRKYEGLLELGLLVQNFLDDAASLLEKLQATLSFQDPVASWLFVLVCGLVVVVLMLLGLGTTLFLVLLWQVRPPCLQDALPPPPVNYFMRLPDRSLKYT